MVKKLLTGYMISADTKKNLISAKVGDVDIVLELKEREIELSIDDEQEVRALPPSPYWITLEIHRGVVGAHSGYVLLTVENPEGEKIAVTTNRVLLATSPGHSIQYKATGAEYEITDGKRPPSRIEWPIRKVVEEMPKKTTRKAKTPKK